MEGRIEVMGRQGRRCKQLLDDLMEKREYFKLKDEALDHTLWRTRFRRGYGPRHNTNNRMNGDVKLVCQNVYMQVYTVFLI
jgi:hypothetical protein